MSEEEFLYRVECALDGGATLMQLREKERTTREYIHLADKVHSIARRYNVPLIIDDRVDVALATDAEGVHVGQTDMPVSIARKLMGTDRIVGATTKTVPQAVEAYEHGADYLGVWSHLPNHHQGQDSAHIHGYTERHLQGSSHPGKCHRRTQSDQPGCPLGHTYRRHLCGVRHNES